jgi:DNA (cytosine-5)-methyltransferase 1
MLTLHQPYPVTEIAGAIASSSFSGGAGGRPEGAAVGHFQPVAARMVAFGEYVDDGTASAMKARDYKDATDLVTQPMAFDGYNQTLSTTSQTIRSDKTDGDHIGMVLQGVAQSNMAVRRLTPVECERLQGFPDNYTNIPWRKAIDSPDGPRYKALGNSMAVPVMNWIGKRIELQMPKPAG